MARRSSRAAALRGVHILLVCDDAERCELFAQALKYADALITTCASPDDGEALRAAGFQVHLTMPVRAVELCGAVATLAREPAAWPRL
jgi:CheY-like chemotaxis protein